MKLTKVLSALGVKFDESEAQKILEEKQGQFEGKSEIEMIEIAKKTRAEIAEKMKFIESKMVLTFLKKHLKQIDNEIARMEAKNRQS